MSRGHGTTDMPIWGTIYKIRAAQNLVDIPSYDPDAFVRARILALIDYLARLQDSKRIKALNQCSINIICGQGPWERVEWSRQLPQALARRGIDHNFDLWGHDVAHDWPWWKIQLSLYFPRLFG